MFSHRSAVATAKKRHFPELAPHDSSIIHPQAQEPSREFSWLSQWRRTDGRLFPSDNPPHLPACFFLSRPPSPQDQWTRPRVHTDNFIFSISDKKVGAIRETSCLKPELLDWFSSAGRPLSWRRAPFCVSDDASLEPQKLFE